MSEKIYNPMSGLESRRLEKSGKNPRFTKTQATTSFEKGTKKQTKNVNVVLT